MYITNVTSEYDNITSSNYTDYDYMTLSNCTNVENGDNNILFKYLLLSIPSSILLLFSITFMVYTLSKTLFKNK